jgi:hypothetical protein
MCVCVCTDVLRLFASASAKTTMQQCVSTFVTTNANVGDNDDDDDGQHRLSLINDFDALHTKQSGAADSKADLNDGCDDDDNDGDNIEISDDVADFHSGTYDIRFHFDEKV